MAIYRCSECERRVDTDFEECELDPKDHRGIDLLCHDCAVGQEGRHAHIRVSEIDELCEALQEFKRINK